MIKNTLFLIILQLTEIIYCLFKHDCWQSIQNFHWKFDTLLNIFATLKKISKDKLKFKEKTWRTSGLQKIYLLKSKAYQSLLRWKALFKRWNPCKTDILQKPINTVKNEQTELFYKILSGEHKKTKNTSKRIKK